MWIFLIIMVLYWLAKRDWIETFHNFGYSYASRTFHVQPLYNQLTILRSIDFVTGIICDNKHFWINTLQWLYIGEPMYTHMLAAIYSGICETFRIVFSNLYFYFQDYFIDYIVIILIDSIVELVYTHMLICHL